MNSEIFEAGMKSETPLRCDLSDISPEQFLKQSLKQPPVAGDSPFRKNLEK